PRTTFITLFYILSSLSELKVLFFYTSMIVLLSFFLYFFFNDTTTTEIYTLSLHDALPISYVHGFQARHGRQHPGAADLDPDVEQDRKSTRLNSSHVSISYAVFCLKKKKKTKTTTQKYKHQN